MLFPIKIAGKFGYISRQGEVVVPPRFVFAYPFSDGVGVVATEDRYVILDADGRTIFSVQAEWCDSFHEGLAAFSRDPLGFGKQGYLDLSGSEVIASVYDDASAFSDGLASVIIGGATTVIGKSGACIIEADRFEKIGAFKNGVAPARCYGQWGYVNRNGDVVVESRFERAWSASEDLLMVSDHKKLGYLHFDGSPRIDCQFAAAESFSEGFAACTSTGEHWGFIDNEGNFVIPEQFTAAKSFREGVAAVYVGGIVDDDGEPSDGGWGYCNQEGKLVIKPQFQRVENFDGGLARVRAGELLSGNEAMGYIDQTGSWVWPLTH